MASKKLKIAIIGGGASGINTAWFCEEFYDIHIFEKSTRLFGDVNSVSINDSNGNSNGIIDIGAEFISDAYLYTKQIHKHFNIELDASDNSYYYHDLQNEMIFSPNKLSLFFKHLPYFLCVIYVMIVSILIYGFYLLVGIDICNSTITFQQYINWMFFGCFQKYQSFLIIQASSIWVRTPEIIRNGNAYFVCKNWLFYYLTIVFHFKLYRIKSGLSTYLQKMIHDIQQCSENTIYLGTEIIKVSKNKHNQLDLYDVNGNIYNNYYHVILCCDAINAGYILSELNSDLSRVLLQFEYIKEHIFIHHDEELMPKNKSTWSVANIIYDQNTEDIIFNLAKYDIKNTNQDYFKLWGSITTKRPNASKIFKQCDFSHQAPSFHNVKNTKYLNTLHSVQGKDNIWITGEYIHDSNIFSHESAIASSIKIVKQIAP
eukprot:153786_1